MKFYLISLLLLCPALFSQSISREDLSQKNLEISLFKHYEHEIEKKEAAKFLIDNLEIQYSEDYVWVDDEKRTIDFNELDYADLKAASTKFQKLKDSIKLKPKLYVVKDSDVITPEFLIKNIDEAFKAWKNNRWSHSYNFKINNTRNYYAKKINSLLTYKEYCEFAVDDYKNEAQENAKTEYEQLMHYNTSLTEKQKKDLYLLIYNYHLNQFLTTAYYSFDKTQQKPKLGILRFNFEKEFKKMCKEYNIKVHESSGENTNGFQWN